MKSLIVIIALDVIVGFGAQSYINNQIDLHVQQSRRQQQVMYAEDDYTPALALFNTASPQITLHGNFQQGSSPHLQGQ